MGGKICCVTGHRDIPADKMEYVARQLEQEVELAIQEGYTHFISGFARGADLLFAQAVAAQKDKGAKLVLEAAIPYRGRLRSREKGFHQLLDRCDQITVGGGVRRQEKRRHRRHGGIRPKNEPPAAGDLAVKERRGG